MEFKENIYLTEQQVADMLGVSVKKLQKDRTRSEGLPYHKFGRAVRYSTDDIRTWVKSVRVEPEECQKF